MKAQQSERVILIKGDASKWYNQAIFIVNSTMPASKMPVDFVSEAEKIIYNHVRNKGGMQGAYTSTGKHGGGARDTTAIGRKKKGSSFDFMLNLMMILACVAIIAVFSYGVLAR